MSFTHIITFGYIQSEKMTSINLIRHRNINQSFQKRFPELSTLLQPREKLKNVTFPKWKYIQSSFIISGLKQ